VRGLDVRASGEVLRCGGRGRGKEGTWLCVARFEVE
jgi:hypothetical protein